MGAPSAPSSAIALPCQLKATSDWEWPDVPRADQQPAKATGDAQTQQAHSRQRTSSDHIHLSALGRLRHDRVRRPLSTPSADPSRRNRCAPHAAHAAPEGAPMQERGVFASLHRSANSPSPRNRQNLPEHVRSACRPDRRRLTGCHITHAGRAHSRQKRMLCVRP